MQDLCFAMLLEEEEEEEEAEDHAARILHVVMNEKIPFATVFVLDFLLNLVSEFSTGTSKLPS